MKITKSKLKQVIREELKSAFLREGRSPEALAYAQMLAKNKKYRDYFDTADAQDYAAERWDKGLRFYDHAPDIVMTWAYPSEYPGIEFVGSPRSRSPKDPDEPYGGDVEARRDAQNRKRHGLKEGDHNDVTSTIDIMEGIVKDAIDIRQELRGGNAGLSLPPWWMEKVATAALDINSCLEDLIHGEIHGEDEEEEEE